jgi:formylglycine-generating enzyme required for sulfatase activity
LPASGGEVERFKIGQRGVPHRLSVTLTDGVIKMYVDDGLQYSSDAGNFNIDMFYVYAFNDHQESGIPFELNADNVRVLTSGQEEEQEEKQSTDVSLEMLWVEPGTFTMGSPTSENGHRSNETQHEVTLTNGFWLGKHEVTQAQWENVMGDNPSHFKGADRPVEIVSWDEVTSFCEKLTEMEDEAGRLPAGMAYLLPTEAQWEYACRAGTTTAFSFGDELTAEDANFARNVGETTDVGKYPANAWGFHDMHGNVWEWTADWYEEFTTGAVSDPVGPAGGSLRVVRSGAWDNTANAARSAFRNRSVPASSLYILGFRLSLRPASQYSNASPAGAPSSVAGSEITINPVIKFGVDGSTFDYDNTLATDSNFPSGTHAGTFVFRVNESTGQVFLTLTAAPAWSEGALSLKLSGFVDEDGSGLIDTFSYTASYGAVTAGGSGEFIGGKPANPNADASSIADVSGAPTVDEWNKYIVGKNMVWIDDEVHYVDVVGSKNYVSVNEGGDQDSGTYTYEKTGDKTGKITAREEDGTGWYWEMESIVTFEDFFSATFQETKDLDTYPNGNTDQNTLDSGQFRVFTDVTLLGN